MIATEFAVIALFCGGLICCLTMGLSVVWALLFGMLLFSAFAKYKGFPVKEIIKMLLNGMSTVSKILFVFMLIGILTALWRTAGTIPVIISLAVKLITPRFFLAACFLLCCGISFLTGTSVGSAATMGVICMTLSDTMGLNPLVTGGAILSGVYFGDRCSPVSTSALLVSQVSDTDIYKNIKNMFVTAAVPFTLCCLLYLGIGLFTEASGGVSDVEAVFSRGFAMKLICVLPALLILILAVFKVKVKWAMSVSIACALIISIAVQHTSAEELLQSAVFGYTASDAELAALINGGGLRSIIKMFLSVLIAASYTELFAKTKLLDKIKSGVERLMHSSTRYAATLLVSFVSSAIACSQSFAIILTEQLCGSLYDEKEALAIDLEDTAVLTAALIPWSVACSAVVSASGAPSYSCLTAFYLYMIIFWRLIISGAEKRK